MIKPRIWITRRLSDATLERAQRDYDVVINYEDTPVYRGSNNRRKRRI